MLHTVIPRVTRHLHEVYFWYTIGYIYVLFRELFLSINKMCQEKSDHLIVYSKGKSTVKKRREKKKENTELGNRNSRRGERR